MIYELYTRGKITGENCLIYYVLFGSFDIKLKSMMEIERNVRNVRKQKEKRYIPCLRINILFQFLGFYPSSMAIWLSFFAIIFAVARNAMKRYRPECELSSFTNSFLFTLSKPLIA